jgi:hypothetical protein
MKMAQPRRGARVAKDRSNKQHTEKTRTDRRERKDRRSGTAKDKLRSKTDDSEYSRSSGGGGSLERRHPPLAGEGHTFCHDLLRPASMEMIRNN